ncbi:MAG: helix-turn-helix domain-containing protein, partial [Sphingomonadaceae bacterium]
ALARALTAQVYALSFLPVRARLHCELHRLARDAGAGDGTATLFEAPTHEELAQRIGSHREAISREMAALARLGLLSQRRRRLVIHDAATLAAMAAAALGEGGGRTGPHG